VRHEPYLLTEKVTLLLALTNNLFTTSLHQKIAVHLQQDFVPCRRFHSFLVYKRVRYKTRSWQRLLLALTYNRYRPGIHKHRTMDNISRYYNVQYEQVGSSILLRRVLPANRILQRLIGTRHKVKSKTRSISSSTFVYATTSASTSEQALICYWPALRPLTG
jgi:hypothetical protein